MRTEELYYDLPAELIAQTPAEPRDSSRLLQLDRATGCISHHVFHDLPTLLRPNDLLVFNQTRVIPARLAGHKPSGGKAEILLLRKLDATRWRALVGGRRVSQVLFDGVPLRAEVATGAIGGDDTERIVTFTEAVEPWLDRIGALPLPPYIKRQDHANDRYQTIYASVPGSAAAPTAGLHFTHRMLAEAQARGARLAYVTLHVGLDTFKPISTDTVEAHAIHSEWCEVPAATAEAVNSTRLAGGRVFAIGTTSVRTLESAAQTSVGPLQAYAGDTRLFITPGYAFKMVDAMITNFHLPRSSLLALVGAFAGLTPMWAAYRAAIEARYRFFSFGDAMVVVSP